MGSGRCANSPFEPRLVVPFSVPLFPFLSSAARTLVPLFSRLVSSSEDRDRDRDLDRAYETCLRQCSDTWSIAAATAVKERLFRFISKIDIFSFDRVDRANRAQPQRIDLRDTSTR